MAMIRFLSTGSSSARRTIPSVFRGTEFEQRSQRVLQNHLSMSLRRVGGKSDGGIDLMGWWWLPAPGANADDIPRRRRLRILAQCKAEEKKVGPKYVREMEGVLHRYVSLSLPSDTQPLSPHSSHQFPLVALLVSESPYTLSTLLRVQSSPIPFFLLHLPPQENQAAAADSEEQWAGTAVWNSALSGAQGLLRGEMETRWERSPDGLGRPSLWWRNQKLKNWIPEKDPLDLENPDSDVLIDPDSM